MMSTIWLETCRGIWKDIINKCIRLEKRNQRMRNVSDKIFRENWNIILGSIILLFFFFRKSRRLWDNVEKYCREGQAIDDNMTLAHCILDTDSYKPTHSEYVILIDFPLQQWLRERVSMLRCTYIACIVECSLRSYKCKLFGANQHSRLSK